MCDQGLGMCWLMPNDSPIGAGRAKILAGERDVHNLNFTFIVLYFFYEHKTDKTLHKAVLFDR